MSKAGARQVSLIADYCKIPKSVLDDLRISFHCTSSTFDPNPFAMARNEGQRDVVLRIEDMIRQSKNKRFIEALMTQPDPEPQE
jgi:hypothetical protein